MKILFIILITPWVIGAVLYLANKKEVDRTERELRRDGKLPNKPNRSVIKKRPSGIPWMPYVNQIFHFYED
jgi:hypothetical protein